MRVICFLPLICIFILVGCLEGPSGPAGKDGTNLISKDSIILNRIDFFLYYMKNDSDIIYSQNAQTLLNNIDTSVLNRDSVYDQDGNLKSITFVRARYTPTNWEVIQEITGTHIPSFDTTNWFLGDTSSGTYWSATITPLNIVDTYAPRFYPGHGFAFEYEGFSPNEGRTKIYYWR